MFPWNVNTKRKYEGKKNTLRNEAHKETFNTHYFVAKKKKPPKLLTLVVLRMLQKILKARINN